LGFMARLCILGSLLFAQTAAATTPALANMVFVEGGSFLMGNSSSDRTNERPVHSL
jgi:formylglycine-generating enzyme required for sulfatase activity